MHRGKTKNSLRYIRKLMKTIFHKEKLLSYAILAQALLKD